MKNEFFESEVQQALDVLRSGGVILYPTDTIWGIGCDATLEHAVKQIYGIKQREESKSMIVLLADEREIMKYVADPDPEVFNFLQQAERPTTIIFDNAIGLASGLIAADGSVGIRIVRDEFCRHLVKRLQKPLVSTSANLSGQPAPANFSEIDPSIKSHVHHIVHWRSGETTEQAPSRVVRWRGGGKYDVIRH